MLAGEAKQPGSGLADYLVSGEAPGVSPKTFDEVASFVE